jgi:hypothetical protein
MNAAETVRAYYDALRDGEPLSPFFAERPDAVKFGISERLDGYDEIERGLADQTAATDDWTVESRDLRVGEAADAAWFGDDVRMAWTDAEGHRREFDSRWSGTLLRVDDEWRVASMHVSAPRGL